MTPNAIIITHVTKQYVIHHEKPTLVEKFTKSKNATYTALNDLSLTVREGERVGIIGPNGSGKTTLLKIIAGITSATSGRVETRGKIVSLIGLDAGFHPELSGIDNIFLNGMILGMKKQDIQKHLSKIIRFADIGEFIDVPIHTYSSGMKLRLGFAIGLFASPNILLMDEGMDVGDQEFKYKIRKESAKIFKGKTLIVVTHNMYAIADLCSRIVVLEHGRITYDGGLEAIVAYDKKIAPELKLYLKLKHKKMKRLTT